MNACVCLDSRIVDASLMSPLQDMRDTMQLTSRGSTLLYGQISQTLSRQVLKPACNWQAALAMPSGQSALVTSENLVAQVQPGHMGRFILTRLELSSVNEMRVSGGQQHTNKQDSNCIAG
jgi:hypothetical protein